MAYETKITDIDIPAKRVLVLSLKLALCVLPAFIMFQFLYGFIMANIWMFLLK